MTTASTGDSVKLFLSNQSDRVSKLDVSAQVELMENFHDDQGNQECKGGENPETVMLITAAVVRVNS